MKSLLICEFKKTRRRYVLVTALVIMAFQLCWILYGKYSADALLKGWMMFLYQLPLINAIFLPVLAIVVASRLCDIEHKGHMFKQLCCTASKGLLYDAKLIYGLGIMLAALVMQFAGIYAGGRVLGFGGDYPARLYLLYWLFTILPAFAIYIFQHTLSLLFKNQAIPFFIGIIGEFFGVLSMFLPQFPWLRNSLLWGYFGVLQFVGGQWDKATRISTYYLMGTDWQFFFVLMAAAAVMYGIGRKLFCMQEV